MFDNFLSWLDSSVKTVFTTRVTCRGCCHAVVAHDYMFPTRLGWFKSRGGKIRQWYIFATEDIDLLGLGSDP